MAISSNIKNSYQSMPSMRLSMKDYWDFYLHPGSIHNELVDLQGQDFIRDCILVYLPLTGVTDGIVSEVSWEDAVFPTGSTIELNDIGLVGLDNGFIPFDKSVSDCDDFYSVFTGSTLIIDDKYQFLQLYPVTGYQRDDIQFVITTGVTTSGVTYNNLQGGFYQGFFKLYGYDYQILPLRPETEFSFEFYLRPEPNSTTGYTTINDEHPDNKGLFFYLGTRAENKFFDISQEHTTVTGTTGQTSDFFRTCDYVPLRTSTGLELLRHSYHVATDNKFLFFDESCSGYTICNVTILESVTIEDTQIVMCYSDGSRRTCIVGGGNLPTSCTLQTAYDNSTTRPQIVTKQTLGALTIRRGGNSDSDTVVEIQDGDGNVTGTINGLGDIVFNTVAITSGTPNQFLKADGSVDSNVYQTIYNTTVNNLTSGITEVYSFNKLVGTGVFFDYTVSAETITALRSGTIMGVWDSTLNQVVFSDLSTGDLGGSTQDVSFDIVIVGDDVILNSVISDTDTWAIRINLRII